MYCGFRTTALVLLGAGLLIGAPAARADVTVIGNGLAADCSRAAKDAARTAAHRSSVEICTLAIENDPLSVHDLAATFVNRGVLYLAGADYGRARQDFDAATHEEPTLGEAYVNRGAALIGEGRAADGIAEINRGLELNTSEPEKAYFNRALAEERLDQIKAAYYDYMKAQELKPDWAMPRTELARFHVTER